LLTLPSEIHLVQHRRVQAEGIHRQRLRELVI